MCLHLLIHVPVQTCVFQDEPIFLPLLGEIGFRILLFPQPALAVPLTQVPAGYPPLTDGGYGASTWRQETFRNLPNPLRPETLQQSLEPLLFFFDLDLIEDRSKTCDEIRKKKRWKTADFRATTRSRVRHGGTYVVEGGGVRAGRGHFHLERGDERVVGGASCSVGLPPVLTQAPSQ